jgi:hypothetical protein
MQQVEIVAKNKFSGKSTGATMNIFRRLYRVLPLMQIPCRTFRKPLEDEY